MPATIGVDDFKTQCLRILDDVERTREPLIITKHGKPVAVLVPPPPERDLFGAMASTVRKKNDIISPLDAEA